MHENKGCEWELKTLIAVISVVFKIYHLSWTESQQFKEDEFDEFAGI